MKKLQFILLIVLLLVLMAGCSMEPQPTELPSTELQPTESVAPKIGLVKFSIQDMDFLSEKTSLDIVSVFKNDIIVNWTQQNVEDFRQAPTRGPVNCAPPLQPVRSGCVTRYQCRINSNLGGWHCYAWTYCSSVSCR